jgi:ssDNA-binding Zn-finger/Zn-ribbon topoisomerase 1
MTERRYPPPNDDWWASEQGKGMCRRCGEERMVHKITDGWGEQNFCAVCSHSWVLKSNATWQSRAAMGKVLKVGSTGE